MKFAGQMTNAELAAALNETATNMHTIMQTEKTLLREAASRLQAPAVADIGMAEIETVARSDAKCDGRDFDGLGRADKERYRSRAWAGLRALRTGGSE
jgi:hypothetical protein